MKIQMNQNNEIFPVTFQLLHHLYTYLQTGPDPVQEMSLSPFSQGSCGLAKYPVMNIGSAHVCQPPVWSSEIWLMS